MSAETLNESLLNIPQLGVRRVVSCPLHVIKYETVFYVFMAMCELFEV